MDIVVFSKDEIVPVLRALRGVAAANDRFTDAEAHLVEALGRLHGVEIDAQTLEPIANEEVARIVVDGHRRKRVVQLAIVTALVEGEADARSDAAVGALAAALGVSEEGLRVLHSLAGDHSILARFDHFRRIRRIMGKMAGKGAVFQIAKPFLGLSHDAEVEARFESLASYPEGTLGRELHDHYEEHGFAMPGSADGLPEKFIFHDIGHVLAGYDVDPQGEIQQAAFQAGFMRNDGFSFLLFGVMQFHLGLRLTPIARAESGFFDVEKVIRAAARGAACKVDLSDHFDFWAHAHEPLDELRRRWCVPPLESEAPLSAA